MKTSPTASKYTVEFGLPLPLKRGIKLFHFPFNTMAPGDSFFFNDAKPNTVRQAANRYATEVAATGCIKPVFTIVAVDDSHFKRIGFRCFRTV